MRRTSLWWPALALCWMCCWASVCMPCAALFIVFHAEHDFVGNTTSVPTPALNLCLRVTCLDHPVRSISWINANQYVGVNNTDLRISFFANAQCDGSNVSFGVDPANAPPVVNHEVWSLMITPTHPDDRTVMALIPKRERSTDSRSATAGCFKHDVPPTDRLDEPFAASITLHQSSPRCSTATFKLTANQRCYNFDFPASVIRWNNLPTWSTLNAGGSSLAIFPESDCQGTREMLDIRHIDTAGVNEPKSLMLQQYSPQVLKNATTPELTVRNKSVAIPPFNGTIRFVYGSDARNYTFHEADICYRITETNLTLVDIEWGNLPTAGCYHRNRTVLGLYEDPDCLKLSTKILNVEANTAGWASPTALPQHRQVRSFMLWVNRNKPALPSVDAEVSERHQVPSKQPTSKRSLSWSQWSLISAGVVLVGGFAIWITAARRRAAGERLSASFRVLDQDSELRSIRIVADDIELETVLDVTPSSIVYTAKIQNHAVVVKKLLPELSKCLRSRQSMANEAKKTSRLDHPKIVRLVGIFWTPATMGTVHEFVGVGDLATLLETHGNALSWINSVHGLPGKLRIAMDVAEALMVLHSFDPPFIHGALTPRNVLIGANGIAKIWNIRPDQPSSSGFQEVEDIVAFGELLGKLDATDETRQAEESLNMSASCPPPIVNLARRCRNAFAGDDCLTAIKVFAELQTVAKQFASCPGQL